MGTPVRFVDKSRGIDEMLLIDETTIRVGSDGTVTVTARRTIDTTVAGLPGQSLAQHRP